MVNDYSDEWFLFFLQPIQPNQTKLEIDFITRNLPQPNYRTVVDLCCGTGRHSNFLAQSNYDVTGIDINLAALNQAKKNSGKNITYINLDMRNFSNLYGTFDAVLNLWQSFGYFDETTNLNVLRQVSEKLNSNGRFVLDIYHQEFFDKHQGERQFEKEGVLITENKLVNGNRLSVTLTYNPHGKTDKFDWQLYTPTELIESLKAFDLQCVVACTNFDETRPPSANNPRVQYVFEKAS